METVKLYNGEITVLKKGHSYYREDGSRIEDSVTGIIKILDKTALKYWAANLCGEHIFDNWNVEKKYTEAEKLIIAKEGSRKHSEYMQQKATSGTAVHKFAEEFVNGLNPVIPKEEQARNGVVAFQKWWNETNIKVVKTERIVYSRRYDVIGTCDVDAKIKGKFCVVDYKTSSVYKKAKFWEREEYPDGFVKNENGELVKYPVWNETKLQVAAYRGFLQEETGEEYGDSLVVRFDKDFGDFFVEVLPAQEQDRFYQAFLHLVPVKRLLDKYKIDW